MLNICVCSTTFKNDVHQKAAFKLRIRNSNASGWDCEIECYKIPFPRHNIKSLKPFECCHMKGFLCCCCSDFHFKVESNPTTQVGEFSFSFVRNELAVTYVQKIFLSGFVCILISAACLQIPSKYNFQSYLMLSMLILSNLIGWSILNSQSKGANHVEHKSCCKLPLIG